MNVNLNKSADASQRGGKLAGGWRETIYLINVVEPHSTRNFRYRINAPGSSHEYV